MVGCVRCIEQFFENNNVSRFYTTAFGTIHGLIGKYDNIC